MCMSRPAPLLVLSFEGCALSTTPLVVFLRCALCQHAFHSFSHERSAGRPTKSTACDHRIGWCPQREAHAGSHQVRGRCVITCFFAYTFRLQRDGRSIYCCMFQQDLGLTSSEPSSCQRPALPCAQQSGACHKRLPSVCVCMLLAHQSPKVLGFSVWAS